MKVLLKIALLLLLPVVVSAQSDQKQLDSLQVALKNAANDTIRMNVYYELGLFYNEINLDSSIYYLDQSIPLAQKLELKINEAWALSDKGYMLMKIGNYPRSLESFLQVLKIAEDPASEKTAWNLPKGRTPRKDRLDVLGFTRLEMGHLYGTTGNTDKQISNYFTAISLGESVPDTGLLALADMNLGHAYINLNKSDSALLFEQRALDLFSKLPFNGRKYEGVTFTYIGNIYQQKGNFKLARDAYLEGVKANTEHNNFTNLEITYLSLGGLYLTLKKSDSSLVYALKALETAKSIGQPGYMADAYKFLSTVYSYQKNNDSTLKYLQLYTALNDSLNTVDRKNLLAYQNVGFDEQIRLQKLEEEKIQTQTRIRTYSMLAGIIVFMLITFLLYRNNRNRKKANGLLRTQKEEIAEQKQNLEQTLSNLKATQSQLIQSEKMASLGELTAGIAHEIQNPLNFVNNFSEVNKEMIAEMKEEIAKGNYDEVKIIADDVEANEEKINHHGKRAGAIVKGMLQHSQSSTGKKEPTDINALADEYLRLSYHGLRAKDKEFNATMKTDFDETIGKINIIPQDIGRVLLNLYNNAFYAVSKRQEAEGKEYEPTVSVTTKKSENSVVITVSDNGNGIPQKIVDKIFQPFFTTKPTGQGTGLGLSLSYDIVKTHGGEIKVLTKENEATEFIIQLPV